MCTTHCQYICGFYPAMNIIKKLHTNLVACKHAISLEVCCHTYSALFYLCTLYARSKKVCLEFTHEYFMYWCAQPSTPNTVFKTHSTIRCDNTPMEYQSFTHQIWVMVCYDLAHQIRWAKHTFSGRCGITPMVCCSFGGHSTP